MTLGQMIVLVLAAALLVGPTLVLAFRELWLATREIETNRQPETTALPETRDEIYRRQFAKEAGEIM